MNSYLANILHRHSGADSLVTPRLRSRFETEDVGSAKPMPIHHPDMIETQEEHQAGKSLIPKNHSALPTAAPIESQRIDPEERRPAASSEPVVFRDDRVQPKDGGIRSTADESVSVGEDVTLVESRYDTPASQQLSRESLRAEPNRQTHPEVKMPDDLSKPVKAGGDLWGRRDDLIQPIMKNSVSVDTKPSEMDDGIRSMAYDPISVGEDVTDVESRNDTPVSQQLSRESLQAEPNRQTHPEVKMPLDHSKPVEAGGDPWGRRDDLIQPIMKNSVSVDARPTGMDPPYDKSLLQQQDRQPISARPVEQTRLLENDTLSGLIQRNPSSETEKEPARTANLTEKSHAQSSETGLSFDHALDNRINIMLARLQDNQKMHSTEHAETNVSDRLMDTKPDHAGKTEKERAAQSLLAARSFDQSKKLSLPDADQKQQIAGAPDNRDRSSEGLLSPPAWLSEVQTQFNRQWNETNGKNEPEPVINVTIGRVEVRAVQADTPPRAQRKKKPTGVMSLDEYLNQRKRRS